MKLELLTGWELRWTENDVTAAESDRISAEQEGWMQADLPCDIHEPLVRNGWIRDPAIADFAEDGLAFRDKVWWFRRKFQLTEEMREAEQVFLVCQSLDAHAEIVLNGTRMGHHESAFHPFTVEIGAMLKNENTLLIRLSSGETAFSEADLEPFRGCISEITEEFPDSPWIGRGDRRRVFVRKSQFSYGWDWSPPVPSCGIMGPVFLQTSGRIGLRALRVVVPEILPVARVKVEVELENHHDFISGNARLTLRVIDPLGNCVEEDISDVMVRSGLSWHQASFSVGNPELWWCNGLGGQPLYRLQCVLEPDGGEKTSLSERFGIRTLRLLQESVRDGRVSVNEDGYRDSRISEKDDGLADDDVHEQERLFAFELNGIRLFAKGANWVPSDPILSRVTDGHRRLLVQEATQANFNMLRVWGGGIYETDAFYDACDEAGILVWQDFMFACALYPDRQAWFLRQVEQEADYQTRRLRNHACMALWCGCNENFWFFDRRYVGAIQPSYLGGAETYNRLLPRIVQTNCPEIPYVNGSPYGGLHPNDSMVGDTHHWDACMMSPDMADRITPERYDHARPKFVSEYGHIGPPCIETMRTATGMPNPDLSSRVWNMHVNPFERDSVLHGIRKHFRSFGVFDSAQPVVDQSIRNAQRPVVDLSIRTFQQGMPCEQDENGLISAETYCLLGGLLQGLMLGYSLDSFRISPDCQGGLFWMFADCWGEVGWSIVDNQLRRKPAWYFVKRSFRNLRLILRESDGCMHLHAVNDTHAPHDFRVSHGWIRPGSGTKTSSILVEQVAPHTKRCILSCPVLMENEMKESIYYADSEEDLAIFRRVPLGDMPDAGATVQVVEIVRRGPDLLVTVEADAYAYGVHLDIGPDIQADDLYFEMIPGQRKTIRLYGIADRFPGVGNMPGSGESAVEAGMLKVLWMRVR